jgi:hypothetical protein
MLRASIVLAIAAAASAFAPGPILTSSRTAAREFSSVCFVGMDVVVVLVRFSKGTTSFRVGEIMDTD